MLTSVLATPCQETSPPNHLFCFHNIRMIPTKDSDQQSRQLRLRLSDLGWEQVSSNIADWTQVASIDLTSNPLECDCKLLWLKDLLSSIEAMHSVRILIYLFQKFCGGFKGASNPLECDCKLLWLKDLLSSIEAMHSIRILIYMYFKSFMGAFWGLPIHWIVTANFCGSRTFCPR